MFGCARYHRTALNYILFQHRKSEGWPGATKLISATQLRHLSCDIYEKAIRKGRKNLFFFLIELFCNILGDNASQWATNQQSQISL